MTEAMPMTSMDDARWSAVVARDPGAAAFVYGVRTTGVYCRPGCASRRPRREHVAFFDESQAAERAGFRACRRCRPTEPRREDPAAVLVRAAIDALERNDSETTLRLPAWAVAVGTTPSRLQRAFRRVLGVTPRQFQDQRRVQTLKRSLRRGGTVTEAMYEAGYGSSSRLYEKANLQLGMTPRAYGRGGAGMHVAYRIAASPLGRLLVAGTEHGVCFVALGDDDRALARALREEYPKADLREGGSRLAPWMRAIAAHLRGGTPLAELPTDVRATAFQRRVWEELRAIPTGTTRSYGEIARRLRRPGAARAVARACASNPLAIVVPCHRVVAAGGGIGGYRHGVERKRVLLQREARRGGRR